MCSSDLFLEFVIEIYEVEIEVLNSQEQSYQFRDPRAFLESLPRPKQEEISLPFDVQVEEDCAFKSHTEDAVNQAVKDANSPPVMEGLKEESLYHVFADPMEEYMEALIGLAPQALILCKSQIHQKWSPLVVALVLKTHIQSTLWLSLTSSQIFYPFFLLLN